ncbi:DUF1842 domain-containing protein [Chromobacterium haemolyticum]|nr:DUF1842 domain-containing protein [Chromobacterium haemolyticum]
MSATGLFHTRYIVSAPVLGAPVLTLDLLVNTPQKKVSGHASIFQSVSPPLQFQANVWGHYSQAKLDPSAEHHIVLSLDGSPSSPNSQIAETFHLQGILDQNWKDGHASYRFFYQNALAHRGARHRDRGPGRASGAALRQQALPPPHSALRRCASAIPLQRQSGADEVAGHSGGRAVEAARQYRKPR